MIHVSEEGFDGVDIEMVFVQIFFPFFFDLISHVIRRFFKGFNFRHFCELLEGFDVGEVV